MSIEGEPSGWVVEWQERGLTKSVSDAVRQALIALHEKFQLMDERTSRLRSLSDEGD
jgi:Arc/MetJ-type ribon-helix-helix transcriptional regulator